VIAILAGSFGAFFHRRGMERDPPKHLQDAQGFDCAQADVTGRAAD
jgi:hypothetical protein